MSAPSPSAEPPEPRWLTPQQQEAWVAISGLCLLLPSTLDAQLQRDSRLTLFEYFVLSRLSMAPAHTLRMSELAMLANGSLSRLSNVVKRVEQRGWVHREPDPADGRFTLAVLTDEGYAQVVDAAPGHVAAVRSAVFDCFTDQEAEQLAELVGRVVERVQPELSGRALRAAGNGPC